ncbi:MAG: hypothetical protein QXU47_01945 [Candidatus Bathyarchaeia archaeon]
MELIDISDTIILTPRHISRIEAKSNCHFSRGSREENWAQASSSPSMGWGRFNSHTGKLRGIFKESKFPIS